MDTPQNPFTIFAPAKVNLYLHILNRLPNGYHALDSLIGFCSDIGDSLTITPDAPFGFSIDGDFAGRLQGRDLDHSPDSANLIIKAIWKLSRIVDRAPDFHVHLTKSLPLGAGIGGGSSDAAAMLRALCQLWGISPQADFMPELLASLGADVPVCFAAQPSRVIGIGDDFTPVPALSALPSLPIVLVHPARPCHTPDIFRHLSEGHQEQRQYPREAVAIPSRFNDQSDMIDFLQSCENVLSDAAIAHVPDIANILQALSVQDHCALSRMSGSGSCCFGIFADSHSAAIAAKTIQGENPDWWVKAGNLYSNV